MSIWEKLFGGSPREESAPKSASTVQPKLPKERPPDARPLPGSRCVAFQSNGCLMVMPRDAFEHHYAERRLPTPAQHDLDSLLPTVTRARVTAGGIYEGASISSNALVDTSDNAAIERLRACLVIDPGAPPSRCLCFGGPTLELFAGDELLATLGLQHGKAIRWSRWQDDATLVEGGKLNEWLGDHGVVLPMLELLFENGFDGSGPAGLAPVIDGRISRRQQRLWAAEHRRAKGDAAGALKTCDKIIAKRPDIGYARAIRARCRDALGDHAGTIEDCTAALDLGFRHPDVFFARAVAHDLSGRPECAIADCGEALALDPEHANALNSRGGIRLRSGDVTGALADLNEAVRVAPDAWMPRMARAQAFMHTDELTAAISDFGIVIEALSRRAGGDPSLLATMLMLRGECHKRLGHSDKALADTTAAGRLGPSLEGRNVTIR